MGKLGCLSGLGKCLKAVCNPDEVGKAYSWCFWEGTVLRITFERGFSYRNLVMRHVWSKVDLAYGSLKREWKFVLSR